MTSINFGILTVSDTCSADPSKDESGPALIRLVTDVQTKTGRILKGCVSHKAIVPDHKDKIENILKKWASEPDINVILTSGGTGFSSRDVTPEATKNVIEKETPGISLAMLSASLKITPMAMLSRPVTGICNKTLIINLPGSPKAVEECLDAIVDAIPHAVHLILEAEWEVTDIHKTMQNTRNHVCPEHNCSDSANLVHMGEGTRRLRKSPYPMISMTCAAKLIEENTDIGEVEVVNVWDAFGRILREDVYSFCNLPPFRASIKDGYAVLASDGKGPRNVLGSLEAGCAPGKMQLKPGTCVWVNTGAPVPDDATAVVQVEDTELVSSTPNSEEVINILVHSKSGQDIRPVGSDIEKGTLILKEYSKICAVEMGLLAACGCSQVMVTKLPSVGVLSTGNELQASGEPLKEGKVYDSNKITLMTMIKNAGYMPIDYGIALDTKPDTIIALQKALDQVDVLVTTGSVSMGDKDLLKPILKEEFKAIVHFGRLNMKPGKPTTFATCVYKKRKKFILCLPGNPVSATVTAHLFVLPLLNRLSGNKSKPIVVKTEVTSTYLLDSRPEYARAILHWDDNNLLPKAYSTGNQISSKLLNCRSANALLMLPSKRDEMKEIQEEDIVEAMLLNFDQNNQDFLYH